MPFRLLIGRGLTLALCLPLLLSSHIQSKPVFQERDTTSKLVQDGYTHNEKTNPDVMLDLRIALPWNNRDGLETKLYDVSDPRSANYGKHLTPNEVKQYVQPSEETTGIVTQWLERNGVSYVPMGSGEWMKMSAPVHKLEPMLNASFDNYTHTATGKQYVRSANYEIPSELQKHIVVITPIAGLPKQVHAGPKVKQRGSSTAVNLVSRSLENQTSTGSVPQNCTLEVTPSCVQFAYNLPTKPIVNSKVVGAIQGFGTVPLESDLKEYFSKFRPDVKEKPSFKIIPVDGGVTTVPPPSPSDISGAQTEVNLDMQFFLGIAPNTDALYLSGSPSDDGDVFLESLIETNLVISGLHTRPQVMSVSFGVDEANLTDTDIALMKVACDTFMQVGAIGITALFASGDGGVDGGSGEVDCTTGFVASYPASCPYITAVGATQLGPRFTETAADFSSGGFSNVFPMPAYQANSTAVSNYLEEIGDLNQGLFNASGRAFPDVALVGVNATLILDGEPLRVDGTSISSPFLAGIITLVNERLLSANRGSLGFLNPLLYSGILTEGFNDITQGNNPGCGTNGFPAAIGWDPVTGFGTPNFPALLKALGL